MLEKPMRKVTLLGLALYFFFLGVLTLAPFDFRYYPREDWLRRSLDLSVYDIVANFFLFLPWGFFLFVLLPSGERSSRLRQSIFLSAGLSFLIEVVQIMIPNRFPSFVDFAVNTAAGGIGFLAVERMILKRRFAWLGRWGRQAAAAALSLYLILLFSMALFSWEKLDRWDAGASLRIGNGPGKENPWPGKLFFLAIYDRALTHQEIERHFQKGYRFRPDPPLQDDTLVLYPFDEREGSVAHDRAKAAPPLDLYLEQGEAAWLNPAGLELERSASWVSQESAGKIQRGARRRDQVTVESWIEAARLQSGEVGYLVLLTKAPHFDYFVMQQRGDEVGYALRNGVGTGYPKWMNLETEGLDLSAGVAHLVMVYDLGRIDLYFNGSKIKTAILSDGFFFLLDLLAFNTFEAGGRALLGLLLFLPVGFLSALSFRVRSTGGAVSVTLLCWFLFGTIQFLQIRHPAVFFTARTVWAPIVAIFFGVFVGRFVQAQCDP